MCHGIRNGIVGPYRQKKLLLEVHVEEGLAGQPLVGLDLISGTGVANALRIVQWPTLSLTRPSASR